MADDSKAKKSFRISIAQTHAKAKKLFIINRCFLHKAN
jgi:hypothetical protein